MVSMMNKEKLRSRINKLKLALLLGGTVSCGNISATENNNEQNDHSVKIHYSEDTSYSKISVFNHNNEFHRQSKEYGVSLNGESQHIHHQAHQTLYNLGDGWFMIDIDSSKSEYSKSPYKNNKLRILEEKNLFYLVSSDGQTYDCSFLHSGEYDFMPTGLEDGKFLEQFPDPKLGKRLENQIKETLNINNVSNKDICEYNKLMSNLKLKKAKDLGFPEQAIEKISNYLLIIRDVMESNTFYIGTIKNEYKTHSIDEHKEVSSKEFKNISAQIKQKLRALKKGR